MDQELRMSSLLEKLGKDQTEVQTVTFANLLRMRDRAVGIHSERMRLLAREVCQRMELSAAEMRVVEAAAHLHDLGTIAIPDPILHKHGALTVEERIIMQGHARLGFEALEHTEDLAHIADVVLHHHERYDGKGYPDGLAGDTIPFAARVVSVLDAYESMTSERSYRPRRTDREAAEQLIVGKGTQFDPDVVEEVLKAIHFSVH